MSTKIASGILLGILALIAFIIIVYWLYEKYKNNRSNTQQLSTSGTNGTTSGTTRVLPIQIYSIIPAYQDCTYGVQLILDSTTFPSSGNFYTNYSCTQQNNTTSTEGLLYLEFTSKSTLSYNMSDLMSGARIFITNLALNSIINDDTITELYACDGAIVTNNQINTNFGVTFQTTGWASGDSIMLAWRATSFPSTTIFAAGSFSVDNLPSGKTELSTGTLIYVGQEWIVMLVNSSGQTTLLGSAVYNDPTMSTLSITPSSVAYTT